MYTKLIALIKDSNISEIFLGSGISFGTKLFGAISTFLMSVYITRFYGIEIAGIFYFYLSVVYILAGISSLGMESALVKFISIHSNKNDYKTVKAVFRRVFKNTISLSLVFVIFLILMNITFIKINSDYLFFNSSFILISLTIIFIALTNIFGASLQGLKKIFASSATNSLLIPMATIFFIWLFNAPSSLFYLSVAFTVSTFLTILFAFFCWSRFTKIQDTKYTNMDWASFYNSRGPFFVISLMNLIIVWLPNIILGIFVDEGQVTIYNAALRSAMLLSFIHISVSAISAPKFSQLHNNKDFVALDQSIKFTSLLMLGICIFPLIIIVIFASQIMNFFGINVIDGSYILIVLAVAQFINVSASSFYHVNLMTGNEAYVKNGLIVATFSGTAIGVIVLPVMGTIALAYGTLISIIMLSTYNILLYIRKKNTFKEK